MINKRFFGRTSGGEDVHMYDIVGEKIKLSVMEYGATVVELHIADKNGKYKNVVCGYDNLPAYETAQGYMGAIVGRCANRIRKGKFALGGVKYNLSRNDGENHLHGGEVGFSHRVWRSCVTTGDSVKFSYFSPDGEEGYPGNLSVSVEYTVIGDSVKIAYTAMSDADTIVNLTNHTYFNLGGCGSGKIFDHTLYVKADRYLPTNNTLIPTGEIRSVDNTPFDFRTPKAIGRDFDLSQEDLKIAGGYDHCLVFESTSNSLPKIEVLDPKSGSGMRVYTNQPCVQFYTGNFVNDERFPFYDKYPQSPQSSYCFETGIMPDSINHENFTSPVLKEGDTFEAVTEFEFFSE